MTHGRDLVEYLSDEEVPLKCSKTASTTEADRLAQK